MADPTPVPNPAPEPDKPRAPKGKFDKHKLAMLDAARTVADAAQKKPYAVKLKTSEDLEPQFVIDLADDVEKCAKLIGQSTDATTDKETDTQVGQTAKEDLLGTIHPLQAKAKRKYRGSPQLGDYFIGDCKKPTAHGSVEPHHTTWGQHLGMRV